MCFEGRGAIGKMQLVVGPLHSGTARQRAPTTIRALWGTDGTCNGVHASTDMESADQEIKSVFPTGSLKLERTLCIVKPDAINHVVAVKTELEAAGFTILKEKQTSLTEERAREFYRSSAEDPAFSAMVKEACSGPCCAMVLYRLEAVTVLKQLMGDASVHVARATRPGSLRARFGRDGQRNALHGSDSLKAAVQDIKFFFPDMGVDPLPDDHEVKDFLFRKSARASMDLQTLSDAQTTDFAVDPTFQQLMSNSLIGLCKVKPQGLDAVKWLANWLAENNPNSQASGVFDPPARSKQYVEYGVNQEGMPFQVEAPAVAETPVAPAAATEEAKEGEAELNTPPFVVFVAGGPGCGKGTQCTKLREEFNLIHLSTGDLMRAEVASGSSLGGEIEKHMASGSLVPDEIVLKLLKNAMVKNQDTNRFLLDGFPRSVEQAQQFERDIAEVSFLLYLEASHDTMKQRIQGRAQSNPGRVDDNDETVRKRLEVFDSQTMPLVNYYGPIGKLRKANAEKSPEVVYAECKRFFSCRFLYLLGPPGAPVEQMSQKLEKQYGYAAINLTTLLRSYANSNEPEAPAVRKALAAGKPVDASIACPLILSEIYRDMALGVQNFVLADFPQSLKQAQFLEYRISCITRALVLDFSKADASDLAAKSLGDLGVLELELRSKSFFGQESSSMLETIKAERIPCKLSEMQSGSVVDCTWKKLSVKVLPALTVVLGLPGSATNVLASILGEAPNTLAVDCNELLDKELERRTEMGLAMHNMLAKGQVVPLSMTLELLKGVANLTCPENLVLQNCPQYVDQIELIENEFRIEKVYYISGSEQAETLWAEEYAKKGESGKFLKLQTRLQPIAAHFSRLGKLEKFEVSETPSKEKLQRMLDNSKMPQFAIVNSMSPVLGSKQAEQLGGTYGSGVVSLETLKGTCPEAEGEIAMLKQYTQGTSAPLVVLHNFPSVDSQAHAFVEAFGAPRVVLDIECDDEYLEEEWKGLHEEDEFDAEQFAEKLGQQRASMEATSKVFKQMCPGSCLSVDKKLMDTPEIVTDMIQQKLWPTVYVLMAPRGASDFGNLVAEKICTSSTAGGLEDAVPTKYTMIDAMEICKSWGVPSASSDGSPNCAACGPWMTIVTIVCQTSGDWVR
ncbi:Adenylate kinase isoenzyme 1 (AK 1) (ATP-AMP transphosphorylase 1) (ATP:AMP phosphotransferase) (Adenylate monophosphate kinase) (Myokinase) [Durusdinium trenchii]|uniref:Adenylate kinase isoenzyme 1 (AK 1) (ATP-AMP transphosphorylase 1) (ATP:AMP phosphotransferase) (Adenylate monophosphate kinase) (Myokinase) n=1 Tax=Durusdinium trenchii TaxID=1381693 RepID=A0ABP0KU45_9DINO